MHAGEPPVYLKVSAKIIILRAGGTPAYEKPISHAGAYVVHTKKKILKKNKKTQKFKNQTLGRSHPHPDDGGDAGQVVARTAAVDPTVVGPATADPPTAAHLRSPSRLRPPQLELAATTGHRWAECAAACHRPPEDT